MANRIRAGSVEKNRIMRKINKAGSDRARLLCELIVQEIASMPKPRDDRHDSDTTGTHLLDSYYVAKSATGDGWQIKTDRRYWKYVEFGTRQHGDAQPHIRPAIETVRALKL